MSWPPRDNSSRPPIYRPSGLLSSEALSEEQSRDRPRLPPLSTLLASSHSGASTSGSYQSHGSSSTYTRTERSPIGSHTSTPSSHASPNIDRHTTAEYRDFLPLRQPTSHSQRPRSISTNNAPVSLPPLTSLSLQARASRSPPSFSTQFQVGRDSLPPRLPSTSYSATSRRRPSPGPTESSSSSATTAGIGPIRRRMTSTLPTTGPYQRHSPVYEQDYFNNVWEIYTYACRLNDEATPRALQSYPSIATGDVQSLVYHLHGELDRLDRRDPRLSYRLAQDAGLTSKRQASTSSFSSYQRAGTSSTAHRTAAGDLRSELHHDEKRTPSDDTEMSSSQGSFTSLSNPVYSSGLPGFPQSESSSTHRRRLSASTSSAIGRSPQQSFASPKIAAIPAASGSTSTVSNTLPPKRVRKRKDETEQSCLCCSATETPEWRKGPTGPRTLCNACGLLFAKQCRRKEMEAQGRGERPRGSRPQGPEIMTGEERQRSLAELKVAVNARTNASPPI